ncbi:MAG: OmpA family protein [Oscillospiraceae bacterium]|jgi:chemotaxis protein MotB|nr:OmpA family protein [Oscillospiraceae bacterium]
MAASSDDRGNERAGGGGEEAEERTDGWMTSYADMVTLLMTFFVLMFALSSADTEKATLFMAAMSRDGISAEQFWEIRDMFDPDDFGGEWDDEWPRPGSNDRGGEAAIQGLYENMSRWLEEHEDGDSISLVYNGDHIMLMLKSDILFASGSVDITPEMLGIAETIAELLAAHFVPEDPFEIVVSGHTDNVPINTPQYPSNWHISRDRALNFLWILVNTSDLDPGLFLARACGEYRPIASNDTAEGRALNRRVEVLISLVRDNPLWDTSFSYD